MTDKELKKALHGLGLGLVIHTQHYGERELNCKRVQATSQAWLAARKNPKAAAEAYNQVFEKKDPASVQEQWTTSGRWLNSSSTRLKPTGWMSDTDWQALIKRIQLLDARPDPLKPKPVGEYYSNEFIGCK